MSDSAANPLRAGLRLERTPSPSVLVIFGASGDLTKRKLMPALWALCEDRALPPGFSIVGIARNPMSHDDFRKQLRDAISEDTTIDAAVLESFLQGLYYHAGTFENPNMYSELKTLLDQIDSERGTGGNRAFYCATPPSFFPVIIEQLGKAGLVTPHATGSGWTRIVVEKPFGRDLASAKALNQKVLQVFNEKQVYRIDHYLGKETVQNLLVLRFANTIWEPTWNRQHIDNVQITVAESLGVEQRGTYYEEAGLVRDMIANHMLQLLTMVAMEPPVAFDADAVRDEKVKVLRAVRPFTDGRLKTDMVRGQYGPGYIDAGKAPGYREEPKVSPTSNTETYAAIKFWIDNWRWEDVPFLLRSGKHLPKRVSEIAIQFKPVPHRLFQDSAADVLSIRIQPDEGITLQFDAKVPGQAMRERPVLMDFRYGTSFDVPPADAYQRLLLDVLLGDSTLFARHDEVEAAWTIIDPILSYWGSTPAPEFPNYDAGSWGPDAAEELLGGQNRRWRRP